MSLTARMTRLILSLCIGLLPTLALAQERFDVAVVIDGSPDRLEARNQVYIDELLALTEGEFDVRVSRIDGGWTIDGINAALDQAYADPEIEMVMATGFAGNQIAAMRREFPKPTFLPVMLDVGVLPSRALEGKSGIRNLNYLTLYTDFGDDLDTMTRMVDYRNVVILMGELLAAVIPDLRQEATTISEERDINFQLVAHDGTDHKLMGRVPPETDAIFITGLPRMPADDFDRLIETINAAGIPSYSFVGIQDVRRGVLVTNSARSNLDKVARLNALNMQAVMIGGRTEEQDITFEDKRELTINMATARQIGLSPSFEVVGPATLLNREVAATGEVLGLEEIALAAIAKNQDLAAEQFGVLASAEEIARARANLLPQLNAGASYYGWRLKPAWP